MIVDLPSPRANPRRESWNNLFSFVYHLFLQDVRVLHNIVDQVAERPMSKSQGAFFDGSGVNVNARWVHAFQFACETHQVSLYSRGVATTKTLGVPCVVMMTS